ncbi:MAG TPA: hypothetical protein VIQ97_04410 [Prevotella sp.]
MTKVEAIAKVMEDNGGTASLETIYNHICKYYPTAKQSANWAAGIRGVLYREINNNRRFKKIGLSIYALMDYQPDSKPKQTDKVRWHSYMEGICVELGNLDGYDTYTADPSAVYRDRLYLRDFTTMPTMPQFTYEQIVNEAKRIDVVWLNKHGLSFPQYVFEIVDSIGTLNGAVNRSLQLLNFNTHFIIVAPSKHRAKYEHTFELEVYKPYKNRFTFWDYESTIELYESSARKNKLEAALFRKD